METACSILWMAYSLVLLMISQPKCLKLRGGGLEREHRVSLKGAAKFEVTYHTLYF